MRRAVLQVLRASPGEAIKVADILERAQAMGATTKSADPINAVDLQLYGLRDRDNFPVEKVGPRVWRWNAESPSSNGTAQDESDDLTTTS